MQRVAGSPGKGWSNAEQDRVDLVDAVASWPAQFQVEAELLRSALPPVAGLRIEHFGSTAVPDLRAKPIIDVLVLHPQPQLWPDLVAPITSLGYVIWAGNPRKDRMFFVKGMPPFGARRTHHVHVRIPEDGRAELAFRDALRGNPALVRRYEELKRHLAEKFAADRDAYTEGKTAFVEAAIKEIS